MDSAGEKESQRIDRKVIFGNAPPRILHVRDIVAAAFNICNSWAGISATLYLGIIAGGPVTIIYGFITSTVMVGCCILSMAEVAAGYPTAGGQYHWTWLLSPPKMQRGMSYTTGMVNIFAWTTTSASVCAVLPSLILGLATFWNPAYVMQKWQGFLVYQVSNIVTLFYNIGILRRAVWTHDVGMALSVLMMLSFFIASLARASPKLPSSYVWTEFVNTDTGWSNGVIFLIGLVNPNFGFVGVDGAIHLAEDALNAATAVPWALVATVLIGFVTAFPFVVAMFYCISDPDPVLASPAPIFEIWRQAVRSDKGATAMTIFLIFTGYFALNATQQTASRLTWSFARDRALVLSGSIGKIHPTLGVPLWGLLANAFVVFVMGCIYLGSTASFNAIVANSLILMHITFAIVAGLKILNRCRGSLLPYRSRRGPWNLGPLGWLFDFVTVAWGFITSIFYCFPSSTPTSGSGANYAAAVLVVMALFAVANWFVYARKHYRGPRVDLEKFR